MTFTERNMDPREAAGPVIPEGVRTSLLGWFADNTRIDPATLWHRTARREGYGNYPEIAEDIRARFGDDEALKFQVTMDNHFRQKKHQAAFAGVDYDAEPALKVIPAPMFLDVLEDAVDHSDGYTYKAIAEINRLFAKRGIYYRFNSSGQAVWQGDPGAYIGVLKPALDALADPRLQGARSEFEAAMNHLRAGTVKDEEDVVDEAAKAVESTMKVLLQEHRVVLMAGRRPRPFFRSCPTTGSSSRRRKTPLPLQRVCGTRTAGTVLVQLRGRCQSVYPRWRSNWPLLQSFTWPHTYPD